MKICKKGIATLGFLIVFGYGPAQAGEYTLEVAADGGRPTRQKLVVPSENYDLEIK